MLGHFAFSTAPADTGVQIRLFENEGVRYGVVGASPEVSRAWESMDFPPIGNEPIRLGFALSHAVLIAALCHADLVLTGDFHSWPTVWGELQRLDN